MSKKTYTNVTLEDIERVLDASKGWNRVTNPISHEHIFSFPLSTSPHIEVRVCSGIVGTGSRGCGKDAIRVFAVDTRAETGYIKTKRVYRIGTWEKNLRAAVIDCFYQAKTRRDSE